MTPFFLFLFILATEILVNVVKAILVKYLSKYLKEKESTNIEKEKMVKANDEVTEKNPYEI